MKKFVFVLLCSFMVGSALTGCGFGGQSTEEAEENADSESRTEEMENQSEETPEEAAPEKSEEDFPKGSRIEEQSFQVNLRPLGNVSFVSYEPDTSENPLADAVFTIEKDGEILQRLPEVFEGNCRANEAFYQVEAVSFLDYNRDNFDDMIVICSYSFASGPDSGKIHSEIRYYTGSADGDFSYEAQMSQDASGALSELTIQAAKDFIGAGLISGKGAASGSTEMEPWQRFYIGYLENSSEVEMQEGYTLIYLDDDEIPELVEIGDCEATGCRIVNYSKGEVHVTQLNRLYFSYIEKGNLLCNSEGNMDSYYDLVYSIVDGELTLIGAGYYGAEDNSHVQFDEAGEPIYQYEWDGVKMSREAYGKALNSVYDTSKSRDGYAWGALYSVEEIKDILKNYQGN